MTSSSAAPLPPTPTPPSSTVGRAVWYQTDGRGGKRYVLPATITCTTDSHPEGRDSVHEKILAAAVPDVPVIGNPVPIPNTDHGGHVHLHVMTPGPQTAYTELSVPFDDSDEPAPRTWRWPTRV